MPNSAARPQPAARHVFDTRRFRFPTPALGIASAEDEVSSAADPSGLRQLAIPPRDAASLLRWLLLLVSLCSALLLTGTLLGTEALGWGRRALGTLALSTLTGLWLRAYLLARFVRWHRLAEAASLLSLAMAVGDPLRTLGVTYAGACYGALFGGPRQVALSAATYLGFYLLGLVIHPVTSAGPGLILAQVPGVVVLTMAVHAAARICTQLAKALGREAVLAKVGGRLVGARDRAAVYQTAARASGALVGAGEGVRVRVLAGAQARWSPVAEWGEECSSGDGLLILGVLREEVLEELRLGRDVSLLERPVSASSSSSGAEALRSLTLIPVCVEGQLACVLFIERATPPSPSCLDSLRALATALGLALQALELHEELARNELRFRALVQNSSDSISVISPSSEIRYQSLSIERIFGHHPEALRGTRFLDLVHPEDAPGLSEILAASARQSPGPITCACRLRTRDGAWRQAEIVVQDCLADPSLGGLLLNTRDVEERKRLQDKLTFQAFHDALTGLPNRALFKDRLEHALGAASRGNTSIAVLYLDLDGFKSVNDGLGHPAGDRLLVEVGQRLQQGLRAGDTVARLGGDEFALLLVDGGTREDVLRVAERLLCELRRAYPIDGREVTVGASIGVAFRGAREEDADELLRNADVAMYVAKSRGRGAVVSFDHAGHASVLDGIELDHELPRAIAEQELTVYYQPILELGSSRIIGAEALVRWRHPRRGLLPPSEFILRAEQGPHIVALGRYVLREACRQARAWQREDGASLSISVNLSTRQLLHPGLAEEVGAVLEETGLPPARLSLEITESLLMSDSEPPLKALKALGVRLALDDFGTGYCSLNYLRRIPVDTLKIDRCFVTGMRAGAQERALVAAIVSLGLAFDLDLIAEGISHPDEVTELRQLGCRMGQGFLFGRPTPAEELTRLLGRQREAPAAAETATSPSGRQAQRPSINSIR